MPRRVAQGYLIWKSRLRLNGTFIIKIPRNFGARCIKGSVVMTDVQNGDRGDSRSGRSRTIACLLAVVLVFGSTITSSPAQEDASIMKNITVDCSAFKKEADGTWTTSKHSFLTSPLGSSTGPVFSFPPPNLNILRPYAFTV